MILSDKEKSFLVEFIHEKSGIKMNDDRVQILEKNLKSLTNKYDYKTFFPLIQALKEGDEEIIASVLDLATINETHFMRDIKPFNILQHNILPKIIEQTPENGIVKIWSAACSSGQEAYSIAMCLMENALKLRNRKIEIFATDICNKVLNKAREGVYNQFEVQRGLAMPMLIKYFEKVAEFDWKIKDDVKKHVFFQRFNLISDALPADEFHTIFCRNVLIYFDEDTKKKVVRKLAERLKPGGALFLGTAETMNFCPDILEQNSELRSMYVKK